MADGMGLLHKLFAHWTRAELRHKLLVVDPLATRLPNGTKLELITKLVGLVRRGFVDLRQQVLNDVRKGGIDVLIHKCGKKKDDSIGMFIAADALLLKRSLEADQGQLVATGHRMTKKMRKVWAHGARKLLMEKSINKHLADVLMGDGASSLAIRAVKQEVGRRAGIDFDQKKQACSYFHKRLQRKLLKGHFADAPKKKKRRASDASKMKIDFGRKWWQYEVMAMFRADTWRWKHDDFGRAVHGCDMDGGKVWS